MQQANAGALVSTDWLAQNLGSAGLKVVDGSLYLPTEGRDSKAEYAEGHIPGAVFFDIDAIADATSPLPHMFPDAAKFSAEIGALGISNANRVVCYDGGTMGASGRVWWMFRAFGHDDVDVLDGGMRKWRAEGRATEGGSPEITPARFEATYNTQMVRSLDQVRGIVESGAGQVLDARSAGRFNGTEPEPRSRIRSGHMPGAHNLPFLNLLNDDGTLKAPAELEALFRQSGVDIDRPIVTSCGSGITATVPLLACISWGASKPRFTTAPGRNGAGEKIRPSSPEMRS